MRLITDVLREIRRGQAVDQASRLLADVIRAVMDTNKKGSVTIELKVEPDEGDQNTYVLQPVVKCKIPTADLAAGIFFINEKGDLVREDPRQATMFKDAAGDGSKAATA